MKRKSVVKLVFVVLAILLLPVYSFARQGTKTFSEKDFSSIDIGSGMHLIVVQSDKYGIEARGDEDDLEDLRVDKDGSALKVYFKKTGWFSSVKRGTVEVKVTMPVLKGLDLSGGAQAFVKMDIASSSFKADLSGGAELKGNLQCGNIYLEESGGSWVNLNGSGNDLEIEGSGGSVFRLKEFSIKNLRADLSGGSHAVVTMNGILDTEQSGGSQIKYYGKAEMGNMEFSGGSGVSKGN